MKATAFVLSIIMIAGSVAQSFAIPSPAGQVMGRVIDGDNRPVAKVGIGLVVYGDRGNMLFEGKFETSTGGQYIFQNVPYGHARITVHLNGRGGEVRGFVFAKPVHVEDFVL